MGFLAKLRDMATTDVKLKPRAESEAFFDVVGESNYQDALEDIAGQADGREFQVWLQREPANKFDPNAIKVIIDGDVTLAYFAKADALRFQPLLAEMERRRERATCGAIVAGGFVLNNGSVANYGLKLNLASQPSRA